MDQFNKSICFRRSEPVYRQIGDHFRQAILSGQLACGTKLPAVQELSHQFQTSVFTIQTALAGLVVEGLLDRKPRVGTIVRGSSSRLTSVGIYFSRNFWDDAEMGFYHALCGALQADLNEQNVRTQLWFDTRPESEMTSPFPPLLQAVQKREIQAVIAPLVSQPDLIWLPAIAPATALLTDADLPNRVNFNLLQMLRESLKQLQVQGCRSVGIICTIESTSKTIEGQGGCCMSFYDKFVEVAKELGLETRDAWIRSPEEYSWHKESYGYEEFLKLWDQDEHPEGLLVYPDIAARGALTALVARGVSVPKDLKLAVHINDRKPYPCPVPVTQVISRVEAVSEALISMVRMQLSGQKVCPIILPFTMRDHKSSLSGLKRARSVGQSLSDSPDRSKGDRNKPLKRSMVR